MFKYGSVLFLLLIGSAFAGTVDPFKNPLLELEKEIVKTKKVEAKSNPKREVRLFKPKIPKTIDELSLEGVIFSKGEKLLVLLDPKSGEVFFLKEGDPISPSEKIEKIDFSSVTIVKYKIVNGKLEEEKEVINIDMEGMGNG